MNVRLVLPPSGAPRNTNFPQLKCSLKEVDTLEKLARGWVGTFQTFEPSRGSSNLHLVIRLPRLIPHIPIYHVLIVSG